MALLQKCQNNPQNTRREGGLEWQQKQLNSGTPCDQKTPRKLEPILPALCEKGLLSASFVPQRAENHTSLSIQAWENLYRQMKYVLIILVV